MRLLHLGSSEVDGSYLYNESLRIISNHQQTIEIDNCEYHS